MRNLPAITMDSLGNVGFRGDSLSRASFSSLG